MRVIQRREELGFTLEAGEPIRVARECLEQSFHGDLTIESRVARAIDRAHAAFAELVGDVIRSDRGPDHHGVETASRGPSGVTASRSGPLGSVTEGSF